MGQRTQVSGDSMYPTLHNGDNLIVDKLSYRFKDPERYDIIVFPYQYKEETYYIKRIIGLPGETVQIIDGTIYINGSVLDENYGREKMVSSGLALDEIQLGRTSILSWVTTETPVQTAGSQMWAIFIGMILSAVRLYGFGLSAGSAY